MSEPVHILYFAWMREQIGCSFEELMLPAGIRTVADLVDHLSSRGPGFARAFQNRKSIRCAVNQEFADFANPVSPGDEIGFFPPVTGG